MDVDVVARGSTAAGLPVEVNGINVIAEAERRGTPRTLFWPWCASNIAVLSISYGSFFLGFAVSFWQATIAGLAGIVLSFLLVGFVSLAGKRGSAPTMVLSRAAFGVRGNALPTAASWLLLVGWETVLVALSTLATATVFAELGWSSGAVTKVVAFIVVAAVIVAVGMLGFDVIMKVQAWLTVLLAIMTVGYVALTADEVSWSAVSALPGGSATAVLGVLVLAATSLGLGWVNTAADYSRYLPRRASSRGVIGWTTLGGSIAPVLLVAYGILLAGSNQGLAEKVGADPVGALTTLLPTWYLIPFALVAIGGLVSGAILDIYSSGLALLTLGLRVPRWAAAGVDGVLMVLGTIYLVWIASDFIGPFQAFLITLGVPIAAWCGYFLGDLATRRRDYAEGELYDPAGRYGALNPVAVGALLLGTALGWGLVTSTANGFGWEGYLLNPLGLGGRTGSWAYANLGVLIALATGFLAALLATSRVRHQERP
ncbi:MAG TPA: cytosine permease [Mycobacteriales bacterium]|nr:cytosine permease [Mycobacteriales bacterium]